MSLKGRKRWEVWEATAKPDGQTIAQLGGFIEGDGSIIKNGTTVCVDVQQKDPFMLHRLRTFFGGSLGQIHRQGVTRGTYWRWRVSGPRARGVIMTIYKFLSPRNRERARRALNVY